MDGRLRLSDVIALASTTTGLPALVRPVVPVALAETILTPIFPNMTPPPDSRMGPQQANRRSVELDRMVDINREQTYHDFVGVGALLGSGLPDTSTCG